MLRKAVKRSTARKPPASGPSTGNLIGASKASATLAADGRKSKKDGLPFRKAEGLRASLRVNACIAEVGRCLRARDATDPPQRSTELLPALLKYSLDEAKELVEIVDVDRRTIAHIHGHERRVDSRLRFERARRDDRLQLRHREDLDGNGGHAGTRIRGPALGHFFLHDQREAARPWRTVKERADQRAGEAVRNVARNDLPPARKGC